MEPSSAIVGHIQVVHRRSFPLRGAERIDSTVRTTPAAHRKQLEAMRTKEPMNSLRQETHCFLLHPDRIGPQNYIAK